MTTTTRVDIAYPYTFDQRGRTATATYGDHVRQMLEQLLLTNPGERVNRPEFGGGLLQLVFEAGHQIVGFGHHGLLCSTASAVRAGSLVASTAPTNPATDRAPSAV